MARDSDDRLIASFLWTGITTALTTRLPVMALLLACFAIGRSCIIADHGMIGVSAMTGPKALGFEYIPGLRGHSAAEVRSAVIEHDGVVVPLTNLHQKG